MADRRTYADRREYIKRAVIKRRKKIRQLAIDYLGSKCTVCGYSKSLAALDIHHRDPAKKEFGISQDGSTRSWERVKKELKKCILICANCHREIHAGVTQLPIEISVDKQGELLEARRRKAG